MKCPKCQTENPADSKYCKECATPFPSLEDIQVEGKEVDQRSDISSLGVILYEKDAKKKVPGLRELP